MHPPLTPHRHPMCLEIIEEFQKFYLDHPFGKFFGDCTELKVMGLNFDGFFKFDCLLWLVYIRTTVQASLQARFVVKMDEDALNLNDDDYLSVDEMMDQNEDDHGPDPVQDDSTSVMFFEQFPIQLCLLSRHSMFEAVFFASI
ncbi:hypothetical protein DY000_02031299 [Brassica cretica]|uniref:Uncharacterized protein n=1 Tax=Brassica cretica TaxID=69181 RepID=A0ABQ7DGB0_BRACR|nr:hypothetical protein DY000_02031299 [Brassica cretica]